jgi:hypothetical protein
LAKTKVEHPLDDDFPVRTKSKIEVLDEAYGTVDKRL